jgi:hypothetical protein
MFAVKIQGFSYLLKMPNFTVISLLKMLHPCFKSRLTTQGFGLGNGNYPSTLTGVQLFLCLADHSLRDKFIILME